jgi:6-phosphofructokinase
MIVVAEGTRIEGIEHVDPAIMDPHGHHKLNPEVLVVELKKALEKRYGIKTQTLGITYEMRNSPPTEKDMQYAHLSAEAIAKAVREGRTGLESVFKIKSGRVHADVAPISQVSQKRLVRDYKGKPLIDYKTMKATEELGRYYKALFGKREPLSSWLPSRPRVVSLG